MIKEGEPADLHRLQVPGFDILFVGLLLMVCYGCLDEVHEQGVGLEDGALVLRVELCADVPFQRGYLNDFNESALGVTPDAVHSCTFELLLVLAVELIAVAVAFLDVFFFIDVQHP